MHKVVYSVHVERLPAYEEGKVHWSFSLTAGLQLDVAMPLPSRADVVKWLNTAAWRWEKIAVLLCKSGVDGVKVVSVLEPQRIEGLNGVYSSDADAEKEMRDALAESLRREIEARCDADPTLAAFGSPHAPVATVTVTRQAWSAVHGQMTGFPAPLPQLLGVVASFALSTDQLGDADEIVVAPVVSDWLAPVIPAVGSVLGAAGSPISVESDARVWRHASVGEVVAETRCPRVATAPLPSSDSFDPARLWVRMSAVPDEHSLATDMSRELRQRFQRMLDTLETVFDAAEQAPSGAAMPLRVLAFLVLLRDVVHDGVMVRAGRLDDTLAAELLALAPVPLPVSKDGLEEGKLRLLDPLRKRQEGLTIEGWLQFLAGVLPAEIAGPLALSPGATVGGVGDAVRSLSPAAAIDVLRQLLRELEGNECQWRVLLGGWHAAFAEEPAWSSWWLQVREYWRDPARRPAFALGARAAWLATEDAWQEVATAAFAARASKTVAAGRARLLERLEHRVGRLPLPDEVAGLMPGWHAALEVRVAAGFASVDARETGSSELEEGLVVQVRPPRWLAESTAADDPQGRSPRYGMLVKVDNRWCMPNLAVVKWIDGDSMPSELALGVFPAPRQVAVRDELRTEVLTYDQRPSSAVSPDAGLAQLTRLRVQGKGGARRVGLDNPFVPGGPRLVRLTYGDAYRVAVPMFGIGGALPVELVDRSVSPIRPWRVAPAMLGEPPVNLLDGVPQASGRYLRRVPIGPLRLALPGRQPGGRADEPLPFGVPQLPADVWPRASSKASARTDEDVPGRRVGAVVLVPPDAPEWLPEAPRSWSFEVRLPTVAWKVWDRWLGKSLEREVLAAVQARVGRAADNPEFARVNGTELEDPAVVGVRITLTVSGIAEVFEREWLPSLPEPRQGDHPIERFRRRCLRVSLIPGAAAGLVLDGNEALVTVGSEVVELTLAPIAGAVDRFLAAPSPVTTTLTAEVAAALPSDAAARAHAALAGVLASLAPGEDPHIATFVLRPDALDASTPTKLLPMSHLVHAFDLTVQRWRWDGRPLAHWRDAEPDRVRIHGFPFPPAPIGPDPQQETDTFLEPHDGELFGDRLPQDAVVTSGQSDFLVRPRTPHELYRVDLSGHPGAAYFRAWLRLRSRYAGLLRPEHRAAETRYRDGIFGSERRRVEQWRRLLVPCRFRDPVPAPKLRAIVPLTMALSAETVEQVAGWLIVLDETMSEATFAGPAERIEAALLDCRDPLSGTDLASAGPDPTQRLAAEGVPAGLLQLSPLQGPIGHTFDTDSSAPRFHRAAVLMAPPKHTADPSFDVRWWFFQVRFRRVIDARGHVGPRPGTRTDAADLSSPWTAPFWLQAVPASDVWETASDSIREATHVSRLRCVPRGGRLSPQRLDPAGSAWVDTTIEPSDRANASVWAIVTRAVVDAAGSGTHEAFLSWQPLAAGLQVENHWPGECRVRLVEVQHVRGASSTTWSALVQQLFPGFDQPPAEPAAAEEALARILRVSPPVVARVR
ncbi:MAG: hypothetical protein MUC36_18275 [Planctomycetes bacterium]|nr:hypothetical protein [Planctomycetota bacterium]